MLSNVESSICCSRDHQLLSVRHLHASLRVFCQSRILLLFFKHQIVVQSLNSPMFENLLLGDDLRKVFQVALHVEIQTVIVTFV